MILNGDGSRLRDKAILALNSSLLLPQVLEAVRPYLLELAQADSMAVCLMDVSLSLHFQWLVPGPPLPIIDRYAEVVEYDFLRAPIFARPLTVVRDSELLTRDEYERTRICQLSQQLGPRLEHIMAALLPLRPGSFAALALYRHRDRPFAPQNAAVLESLLEHFRNAIRNCGTLQDALSSTQLLEQLYHRPDAAFLIVEPPHYKAGPSPHAVTLLEQWFTPSDFHSSGLPLVLKERLDALMGMRPDERLDYHVWVARHGDDHRTVRFVELPAPEGPRKWALLMHEHSLSIPLPEEMRRKLTPRQITIATYMLRNWTNKLIADELKLSEHTVKTHVRDLLIELDYDSRAELLYRAARFNKPV